jgi:hypothetical protein
MRHPFETYTFHMRYVSEACRFRIIPFWIASECVLMTRRLVWIRSKFRRHNHDVLCCTIFDVQSENSGVMLLKFHLDPNRTSHHKHVLSVTLR